MPIAHVVLTPPPAAPSPPPAAPIQPSWGSQQYLPLSLVDMTRELAELAERDARFERAAELAADLEQELTRLTGRVAPPRRRRRRTAAKRAVPRPPAAERLLEAFQVECASLGSVVQRLDDRGMTISSSQLSDLRLGERTRRIFQDAGLLYVQDVANLSAVQAMAVPHLAPTSVAEVRAAIMFALEAAGAERPPMLPPPGHNGDLFEGAIHGVNQLPARERETVVLRTGVGDRVYDIDEVARAVGVLPEQVPQLERHALNTLLSQPGPLEACWKFEDLCAHLGLSWDDERLPTVVASRYPNTRASFTRLVSWLVREKNKLAADASGREVSVPNGIAHFEEMVVATLGRYGDLSEGALTNHVRAALSPIDREQYPEVEVVERVKILGPAVQNDSGIFRLPEAPIPGVDDRHIRALNGLIGALQRLGSARISALTTEVNRRLPRAYQVNEQFVRSWLTRHPEMFTQSDTERFKLASFDIDILSGLATSWKPGDGSSAGGAGRTGNVAVERLHDRVAVEIAEFLRREGPQTIGRIRSHLYGRFIGLASADAIITASPHRFARQPNGLIALRSEEEASVADFSDAVAPATPPGRRSHFWQRR
jgi:hypothetical protein